MFPTIEDQLFLFFLNVDTRVWDNWWTILQIYKRRYRKSFYYISDQNKTALSKVLQIKIAQYKTAIYKKLRSL